MANKIIFAVVMVAVVAGLVIYFLGNNKDETEDALTAGLESGTNMSGQISRGETEASTGAAVTTPQIDTNHSTAPAVTSAVQRETEPAAVTSPTGEPATTLTETTSPVNVTEETTIDDSEIDEFIDESDNDAELVYAEPEFPNPFLQDPEPEESWTWDIPLPDLNPLSSESDFALREDWAAYKSGAADVGFGELTADDVSVYGYYGTYNGGELVVMTVNDMIYTDDLKSITLAGCNFTLASGGYRLMYHNGSSFTDITDAYNQGMLSDDDIREIEYYVNYNQKYRDAF